MKLDDELFINSPKTIQTQIVTIRVDRDCPNGEVTLTNNGNAQATPGSTLRWIVTSPCISKIEIIIGSKGHIEHQDIWALEPVPIGSKIWEGVLKYEDEWAAGPDHAYGWYSLIWYDQYNMPHLIDPVIRVNY